MSTAHYLLLLVCVPNTTTRSCGENLEESLQIKCRLEVSCFMHWYDIQVQLPWRPWPSPSCLIWLFSNVDLDILDSAYGLDKLWFSDSSYSAILDNCSQNFSARIFHHDTITSVPALFTACYVPRITSGKWGRFLPVTVHKLWPVGMNSFKVFVNWNIIHILFYPRVARMHSRWQIK